MELPQISFEVARALVTKFRKPHSKNYPTDTRARPAANFRGLLKKHVFKKFSTQPSWPSSASATRRSTWLAAKRARGRVDFRLAEGLDPVRFTILEAQFNIFSRFAFIWGLALRWCAFICVNLGLELRWFAFIWGLDLLAFVHLGLDVCWVALICVHLRAFASICGHLRSLCVHYALTCVRFWGSWGLYGCIWGLRGAPKAIYLAFKSSQRHFRIPW